MSKIIENQYGDTYKTPGFIKTTGAIVAGSLAGEAIKSLPKTVAPKLIYIMQKNSKSIDNKLLRGAINDVFKKSGLEKNNVEIIDAGISKNANKLKQAIQMELPKIIRNNKLGDIYSSLIKFILNEGENACFLPKTNKIAVNIDKLGSSAFHEMGHALNKNCSTFWKSMQKLRAPGLIAGCLAFPTIAIFKRKKVEGEEPKGIFDKATTFIKDNAGKLTTFAFVPIVAEELMATHKGEKLAKEFLPKDALKKVKITNRLGASSYIATALLAGVGANIGSKVRDKFAQPKKIS